LIEVHATSVVDARAELGDDVVIGPFCQVGAGVVLGPGTKLLGSVTVLGPTILGARNVVHPYAVIGGAPQDKSYAGEPTRLVIGDDNVFREHVTVNRGTTKDAGETRVGSGSLIMAGAHVAHDCVLGDGLILGNGTLLAGHVKVLDYVVTGGGVAVQPFVRLGAIAFLAGGAMVERDVPPFVIAAGDRARVRGLNKVGLARRGVPAASIRALRRAYLHTYRPGEGSPGELPAATLADPFVGELLAFLAASAPSL
jgi:UDP-N-acetylglucosamine acyltransferase